MRLRDSESLSDEYGGSFENRMRLVLEIIEDIRKKCGKDYVLGCRVSVDEFLNTIGVTEEYIHIQDGIRIVKTMEAAGIDFVDVSCALYETCLMAVETFSVPVVTLSVCHIKDPTFADNYYETILGIYCTYKGQLGMYPISLLLGGQGAEMATQLGRDNSAIPKKLDAEFVIRKNGTKVEVGVVRRGAQIVKIEMELGSYNHPLTHVLFQAPAPGKKTAGSGYYFHFDRLPDENGVWRFTNTCLIRNIVNYTYDAWTPGYITKLEINSSKDDPWDCIPVQTIVGGAYAENNLLITALQKLEDVDADKLMKKILPAWYDKTTFMETGRK